MRTRLLSGTRCTRSRQILRPVTCKKKKCVSCQTVPGRGMPGDTKAYSGVGRGRGPGGGRQRHCDSTCAAAPAAGSVGMTKSAAGKTAHRATASVGMRQRKRGGQDSPPRKTYVGPHRCGVWPVEIRDSGFQIGSTRPAPTPYGTCVSGTGWPRARWSPSWRRGRTGVSCRRGRPPGRACCSR